VTEVEMLSLCVRLDQCRHRNSPFQKSLRLEWRGTVHPFSTHGVFLCWW
jgi:hypothetical protein